VRNFYALMSLSLCGFVAASIFLEFHRGARARQRTAGESYVQGVYGLLSKSRRRYGGYLVHLAMILLFVGFTGKAFTTEQEFVLATGESIQVKDYTVRYEALGESEDANKTAMAAALSLFRDGEFLCTLLPAWYFYRTFEQRTTEVSIYSSWREDFYVILVGSSEDNSAKFQVYINPLVNGVWFGGLLFVLGSLWTMWPTARDRRLADLDRRTIQGLPVSESRPS